MTSNVFAVLGGEEPDGCAGGAAVPAPTLSSSIESLVSAGFTEDMLVEKFFTEDRKPAARDILEIMKKKRAQNVAQDGEVTYGVHFNYTFQTLHAMLEKAEGAKVLELGGAFGVHSFLFLLAGAEEVVLNDLSRPALQEAIDYYNKNLKSLKLGKTRFVKGDFLKVLKKLAKEGAEFDLIVVRNLLHFMPEETIEKFRDIVGSIAAPGAFMNIAYLCLSPLRFSVEDYEPYKEFLQRNRGVIVEQVTVRLKNGGQIHYLGEVCNPRNDKGVLLSSEDFEKNMTAPNYSVQVSVQDLREASEQQKEGSLADFVEKCAEVVGEIFAPNERYGAFMAKKVSLWTRENMQGLLRRNYERLMEDKGEEPHLLFARCYRSYCEPGFLEEYFAKFFESLMVGTSVSRKVGDDNFLRVLMEDKLPEIGDGSTLSEVLLQRRCE
ncbi:MAG: hypothetical protein CMM87_05345 [Rickettsiales bacterium]|nr:hypothetical protein [Rickettsiales bacterium]|tara:strand:- start:9060 stop:10364 length:1305 start_codon:yes stop_codon:yes gene_type:complete